MLQLSHDDVANAPASSSSSASGNPGGNNPATEAVLLHTHYHHHRAGGGVVVGGGPPHEWNFAKAFLYSLTVLTTIGKCQWLSVAFFTRKVMESEIYRKECHIRFHCYRKQSIILKECILSPFCQ